MWYYGKSQKTNNFILLVEILIRAICVQKGPPKGKPSFKYFCELCCKIPIFKDKSVIKPQEVTLWCCFCRFQVDHCVKPPFEGVLGVREVVTAKVEGKFGRLELHPLVSNLGISITA